MPKAGWQTGPVWWQDPADEPGLQPFTASRAGGGGRGGSRGSSINNAKQIVNCLLKFL